jgi:hypothetical protein
MTGDAPRARLATRSVATDVKAGLCRSHNPPWSQQPGGRLQAWRGSRDSSWPNYDCDAPAATIRLSYGMRVRSPTVSSTSWWAARSISVTSPMRDARVALFAEHVADRWCDFPF